MVGVRIEGAKELRRALRQVADDARSDLKPVHADVAGIVADTAQQMAPIRTGSLAASIRSSGTLTKAIVRAGTARIPYAGVIHFGWPRRNITPQPFLYDAMDRRRAEVLERYHDGVDAIIKRRGLVVRRRGI